MYITTIADSYVQINYSLSFVIVIVMFTNENLLYSAHGTIIRDLCLARDNYYQSTHVYSLTKIIMLKECLCTT